MHERVMVLSVHIILYTSCENETLMRKKKKKRFEFLRMTIVVVVVVLDRFPRRSMYVTTRYCCDSSERTAPRALKIILNVRIDPPSTTKVVTSMIVQQCTRS